MSCKGRPCRATMPPPPSPAQVRSAGWPSPNSVVCPPNGRWQMPPSSVRENGTPQGSSS